MSQSLNPTKFGLAEFAGNTFRAVPEHGTKMEEFMQPEFWAHIAAQCKVFDKIEVIPESGEYYAMFVVVSASKTGLRVKPVIRVDLTNSDELAVDKDLDAKWMGPHAKWCVVRKADGAIMYRDMASKEEATLKLAEHISAA